MINNLHVLRFRSFKDLKVEGFGRVNLITGRNNVGKSTLLEAIRILATEGSISTFLNILSYREENDQRLDEGTVGSMGPDDFSGYSSLFSGFPTLANCNLGFTIAGENGGPRESLTVRIGWYIDEIDDQHMRRFVPAPPDLFGDSSGIPALEIEAPNRRRIIRLDRPRYRRMIDESEASSTQCLFLDPFSSRSTSQLAALWDKVALTDGANDVVSALQIISKDIQAVTMIGDITQRSRTAIARSVAYNHPVPLRSFGDGVNRLFGLILSLTCAKGGYLLVDEIENGLHHSILPDAWRTIFRLARELKVQVFATTHSRDCVESFQEAAVESPEDGVLVRLTRKDDSVVPTVLREDQLQIVARDHIEVR